jgi:geranylgeranyl diphosphate synthase type I
VVLDAALLSVVDGCIQEIGMAERDDVDVKHSALTGAACELGAPAAGASRNQADHLRWFG